MKERVFDPIGIQNVGWDWQGGVEGNIGPHTNPHSGLRFSARDFARLGYLMAHDGKWQDKQIVPHWWIELATNKFADESQLRVHFLGQYRWRALANRTKGYFRLQRVYCQPALRRAFA